MTALLAIGGSAGALEALLELVALLPASFTTPIVVVIHVSPTQRSLIPELLVAHRRTLEIEDKQPLEPSTIYVAPPNYHALVERDGTLSLSVDEPVQYSRPSIDVLFDSVAYACGAAATAVLLSGANDDGAAGLARIAAAGGRTYVQDPAVAAQRTMPLAGLRRVPSARAIAISDLGRELAAGGAAR